MATYLPPRTSELRERVSVQRLMPAGQDSLALDTEKLVTTLSAIPAKIAPLKGGEEVQTMRLKGTAAFYVTIRSSLSARQITTSDVLVNDRTGDTYNIRWIANLDERDRFLTFLVATGVANG